MADNDRKCSRCGEPLGHTYVKNHFGHAWHDDCHMEAYVEEQASGVRGPAHDEPEGAYKETA